jgi:tetratricopeptide (TPR) repeat protein
MKPKIPIFLLLAAAITALLSGCGQPLRMNQLQFGVWASEKDLWDEAVFRWKKAAAVDPRSVAAHNNLAVAYEKKGLWEEARKEYAIALKLEPKNTYVKYNLDMFQENMDSLKKDEGRKGANGADEKK